MVAVMPVRERCSKPGRGDVKAVDTGVEGDEGVVAGTGADGLLMDVGGGVGEGDPGRWGWRRRRGLRCGR